MEKKKKLMEISHYRNQRIMLLARLNLGLASENQKEIDLYNYYQKIYIKNKSRKIIMKKISTSKQN